MNILLILLGCNIYSILLNRLEASFKFIEENIDTNINFDFNTTNTNIIPFKQNKQNKQNKITWFLSGGIKNNFKGAKSEVSLMKSQIDNNINLKYGGTTFGGIEWDFVLDMKSTVRN